jgi:hypothetical protein
MCTGQGVGRKEELLTAEPVDKQEKNNLMMKPLL